ncbi:MAG: TetR/AcrR family transcriptional regulator [Myxococcota bacterium]
MLTISLVTTEPIQQRAKETVARILSATEQILIRDGLNALNTNAIASAAGLTPPSVYRYFVNKEAIIEELAARYYAAEESWTMQIEILAHGTDALSSLVGRIVEHYVESALAYPAIAALRTAIRAHPALRSLDQESRRRSARALSNALRARGLKTLAARTKTISAVVVSTICGLIDQIVLLPPTAQRRWIDETKTLVQAYVATLEV